MRLTGGHSFDATALAAAALALPPNEAGETPYRGITRHRDDVPFCPLDLPARPGSAEEAVSWLLTLLERAIDRALTGVKRVGVLAGGGLDSAALLALACRWAARSGGSAFAVALDFASPGDDRPHLRALEQHLACEVVRVTPEQAAPRLALLDGVDGAPFPWPTAPFDVEMLAVARANGAGRCLSGAGGDELFDGNPRALVGHVRRGQPRRGLRAMRRLTGFDEPRSRVWSWMVRPLAATWQPASLRAWRAARHPEPAPSWAGPVARAFLRARSRIDRAAAHRDYIAGMRQQEIVASASDLREPFLDADVIDALGTLPPEWLLHGDARRGLLREALRGLLPEGVRMRTDKARFEPALARFFDASGARDKLRGVASLTRLAALGIASSAHTGEAFAAFARDPQQGEPWLSLWPALATESFLRAAEGVAS